MQKPKAFTIIELLVVISIIALLIGILLPAIGRARDHAHITRSQSNLRQMTIAHNNYAADWNDNQWTIAPHTLFSHGGGGGPAAAVKAYNQTLGDPAGYGGVGILWDAWPSGPGIWHEVGFAVSAATGAGGYYGVVSGGFHSILPISLEPGATTAGYYRLFQVPSYNSYLSGRWYDPVFYAPKDTTRVSQAGECYDGPGQFCVQSLVFASTGSYSLSPAALFTPGLFSLDSFTSGDAYAMPTLTRSPTYSQARYPDLKVHMLEHSWLQRQRSDCNPQLPAPKGWCTPYHFNGALESSPVTLFYDGHVGMLPVAQALDANSRVIAQAGENESLWHHKTPYGQNGFFHDKAYNPPGVEPPFGSLQNPSTSFSILTRHGIRGRDTLRD